MARNGIYAFLQTQSGNETLARSQIYARKIALDNSNYKPERCYQLSNQLASQNDWKRPSRSILYNRKTFSEIGIYREILVTIHRTTDAIYTNNNTMLQKHYRPDGEITTEIQSHFDISC